MKKCSTCHEIKAALDFHNNRSSKDGKHSTCKSCIKIQNKAWRDSNPEKKKAQRKSITKDQASRYAHNARMKKYGITTEEFDSMVESQSGACALKCGRSAEAIDHNHATGAVRALLCVQCNAGIGLLLESPEILRNAASYIEAHDR